MSFHKKVVFAALAFVVAIAFPVLAPAGAADQNKDVRVVNTADQPVPVTLTGAPTVSLAGPVSLSGPVSVTSAVPTDRFEASVGLRFGFNSLNPCVNCDDQILYNVPDGKVAVIQHVSLSSTATEHIVPQFSITSAGNSAGSHFLEAHYVDTDERGRRISIGSTPMTLYAPFQTGAYANQEIMARVVADVFAGAPAEYYVIGTVRVSGYLVDAPA